MQRRTKRQVAVFMSFALMVAPFGAVSGLQVSAAGKKIKLSKTKLTLRVGASRKLKLLRAGKKVKKVTWSTNKKKVATVTKKGVVKARKKGKAVITAKAGKKKYRCRITVKAASPKATKTPSADGTEQSAVPVTPQPSSEAATTGPDSTPQPVTPAPVTSESPVPTDAVSEAPQQTPEPVETPAVTEYPLPQESVNPVEDVAADDLSLSQESGTYDSEFDLAVTSSAGASILYTTDGSDPRSSTSRKMYNGDISITSRKGDANILSAISPDLFDTLNYQISGNSITSRCVVPSDEDVDKCTVVKAVSCGQDGSWSDVVTKTYFIGKMSEHIDNIEQSVSASGQELSVISITVDQDDLFDEDTGIYVKGKYFADSVSQYIQEHGSLNGVNVESDLTSNFKQKGREWERNCHVEYFESDGTNTVCKLQQDCGIRIQGNYSRENVQKSFRLYARDDYGTKNFKYPFFGDEMKDADGETMEKFKTLVLRNGGNDAFNYKYKDIFTQSFVHDRAYDTLYGRPCVLYLNGEYWGYYVLQSDMSDNYLETRYGVDKDAVALYKGSDEAQYAEYGYKLDEGELPEGVTDEDYYLKETLEYLDSNDFSDNAVYEKFIEDYMEEQSAVDYFATMVYLNNGWDWPDKNWSFWRTTVQDESCPYADNRWRFCLSDLDLTTEPTWSAGDSGEWSDNPIPGLIDKASDNVVKKIFGNLMDNAGFRQKLADAITEIGTENYAVETVNEKGALYKNTYSPLYNQFQRRFNSNGAVYSIGEENHNANMSFLNKRLSYVPTIISEMQDLYPEKTAMTDGKLVWEGSWTRYSSSNRTVSETVGLSTARDDNNYIQIRISDWSSLTNPVIKLTVAEGYGESSRLHIWNEDKTLMDTYYTQGETEWIEKEISISALRNQTFYLNVNDATLIKFEIYNQS